MFTVEELAVERERLESVHGKGNVWNTPEATAEFKFEGFQAPFVVVIRKADNVRGTLEFEHMPRFYFDFVKD